MRVPRDVDASDMIKLLRQHGYYVIRQTGSHIRLSKNLDTGEHALTVPNHKPLKIGTLQHIVKDVCLINNLDVRDVYGQLSKF